jgi:hypothetical protein
VFINQSERDLRLPLSVECANQFEAACTCPTSIRLQFGEGDNHREIDAQSWERQGEPDLSPDHGKRSSSELKR